MPDEPPIKQPTERESSSTASRLADFYSTEFEKIRERFQASRDGLAVMRERSALVDAVVFQLHREHFSAERNAPENFCLVALGGYGRWELSPYSDVDLLFLFRDGQAQASLRDSVARLVRQLWDLRLRVGNATRTLGECGRFNPHNPEFSVSLLDCRYLAGDESLFATLADKVIPHLVARDGQDLVRDLLEMTQQRHAKHANTIFHLEPNLKEAPGGLRDFHVTRWLALIGQLEKEAVRTRPEVLWPAGTEAEVAQAFAFLAAARCFVHYARGRDDNQLTYELQDEAASLTIGCPPEPAVTPAEWMRSYFRHTRSIHRWIVQLMDQASPARSSLYTLVRDWKSRHSNVEFSVVRGRIFPRNPAAVSDDGGLLLRLFELVARHGVEPSREAERWVQESLPRVSKLVSVFPDLWRTFRQILVLPYAAQALRTMHRLGLLDVLFPEFCAIDSLVIRDYFHRYTVDEHTFTAIQSLHELRGAKDGWERQFSEIFSELEQPDLLFLALLFHDIGKGRPGTDHIQGSLEALEGALTRLALEQEHAETVRFLIAHHLEMSATLQRRDVFDPETIHAFAEKVGATERLKMLCLLTYADIKAVNPTALTPWKAEMLWQFYAATSNYFAHSVDEERFHAAGAGGAETERITRLLPPAATEEELRPFLEGLPRRYLASYPPEKIVAHFQMARDLSRNPVQISLKARGHLYELTVVTADRPLLFTSITGTLSAWGMNIVTAEAFANSSGTILDTFRFQDLFRTLELNPSETERFRENLVDVLGGRLDLQTLMSRRISAQSLPRIKVVIGTQIRLDDTSSSHSTLLELITQDRPGLLYLVSSTLARLGCNIEVALVDTEGQKAIDVFYLTVRKEKLEPSKQQEIRQALLEQLSSVRSGE